MRIFHLADLHIGKNLLGFSLLEDQAYILAQIIDILEKEKPDALLIAGDIYDKTIPSTEAVRLFDSFLTSISASGMPVFIISGNHDAPDRLAFGAQMLAKSGVYFAGRYQGAIARHTLQDAFGLVHFYLLPFIKSQLTRGIVDMPQDALSQTLFSEIFARENIDIHARNVLLSHQFYTFSGALPETSESEIHTGGLDNIDVSCIEFFDYAALGHLHNPQKIGYPHIRYAGSPMQYAFSESASAKSIAVIDLGEKGRADISRIPLKPLRLLRKIKGKLAELIQPDVIAASNPDDYLHITLTDEIEPADPVTILRQYYPHTAALSWENARSAAKGYSLDADVETLDLPSLFSQFYAEQNGSDMDKAQREIITKMLQESEEMP